MHIFPHDSEAPRGFVEPGKVAYLNRAGLEFTISSFEGAAGASGLSSQTGGEGSIGRVFNSLGQIVPHPRCISKAQPGPALRPQAKRQ